MKVNYHELHYKVIIIKRFNMKSMIQQHINDSE